MIEIKKSQLVKFFKFLYIFISIAEEDAELDRLLDDAKELVKQFREPLYAFLWR